ncbi:conserved hypothetical protein [Echinococcus multilocularis]|uniref:Uncharacterized protein n=1 Tax=Echinococcus multilocularis TaxID=6211 RepID=A0A068Y1Z1_ECHMU|nr:conserved hypothetical protein [Echinococcus multilocularis]
MANVQVANTMQYRSVPATILPETCGNNGRQEQQWYNLALLPSTNSNTPFKAYMPVSMAANLGATQTQPPPSNQCAAPPQNASQAPPVNAKKKAKPEECVTKIIVSNFEGPLTVTCTDVTPKCPPNPIPPPVSQFAPYQPPMPCPEPLPTVRPYYRYPSEPQDSYRPRRSQSKSKSYKKRSKTPKKAKPHGREHAEPPSKEGRGRKKSRSPSPSRSESPRLKPTRSTGPALLSTSTGPLSSVTPNHLPPPPTVEQLQSAVLRPVQPRPKPYSIVTAQTLPLPVEPEKTATRERSKSPERRMYPCHCVPMIYCMPSCPYPYHQPRSSRADRRMQRLLDICEGKSPIKVQVIKELERSYSLPKPRGQRDGRPCQHPSDQTRRSVLPNLTIDHARETTPLKTTIKTSPPPQQPLHSQGLFGMRKVADGEGGGDFRGGRPPSRRGPPLFQPPLLRGSSTLSNPNRGNPAPKLGPKPTIQWPPRIRPGGSDKPTSPPIIEFGGAKRISESSDDRGGGGASQVEGSYEVIWDYFSENGGETDEEGEDREVEEARSSQMVGPSSGSYYNISSKSPPKVILKVKHEEPM